MFLVALMGGITGALIAIVAANGGPIDGGPPTDDGQDERGSLVRLGTQFNFDAGPWCDPHHRFCIPEFNDPEDARAFYMVHTHAIARQRACPVEWLPDQEIAQYVDSDDAPPGAFRGRCIGNVWFEDGTKAYGPAPRALDEFPVTIERREDDDPTSDIEWLLVDTRTLICGEYSPGVADRGCELAPPYD